MIDKIRRALRAPDPLDLLALVSGLIDVTDPRRRDPFSHDGQPWTLSDLVTSFIEISYAETTAALTAIRALTGDDQLRDRIGNELGSRRHPTPAWLDGLAQALIEPDVWRLTDVLGDGDDYLVGVALPSGHDLSAVVYVDHNLGTVVKDAFVVPESLKRTVEVVSTASADELPLLSAVDPAQARAVIEDAIEQGGRLYPPLESDSWPMSRPLVEWMVRLLPGGGALPDRREWSEDDLAGLTQSFFDSPFAAGLDSPDHRSLLGSILWFGTGYQAGDPLRWSPVNVEMLLADWAPRKIVAQAAYLAQLPMVLRAYIRYCQDVSGIPPERTKETLDAVDEWEPEYQRLIRTARPQGVAGLLAGLPVNWADDDPSYAEIMLEGLDREVGGRRRLMDLDDRPLPDEAFEWAGIPDDVRPVLQEMVDACDRVADTVLDVEHRTAMRRFLSRAAVGDPAVFRRKASATRGAAAVAWVICRANETAGTYKSDMTVQDLLKRFGVLGSVSQRAEPLLRANGVDPHHLYGSMDLGAADLLVSRRRADIIKQRDRYLSEQPD